MSPLEKILIELLDDCKIYRAMQEILALIPKEKKSVYLEFYSDVREQISYNRALADVRRAMEGK